MRRRWIIGLLVIAALLGASLVPTVQYLVVSAVREVRMLATARSVASMLADPTVPADLRDQLRFVQDVKAFGIQQLGESASDSYQTFFDTGGKPLGWAVQAAWPDRLEAWEWHYPIVGAVPYTGYPRQDQADAEAARLEAMGLETVVWPIPAYSTLGWLPDPITSNLVSEERSDLGATILHELLHGTIYFPGQTNLNETMAQFVGEQGILAYFQSHSSPDATRAAALWKDEDTFTGFINDLVKQLQALYTKRLPWPQTLRRRLALLREAQQHYQGLHFETDGYRRVDFRNYRAWNNARFLGYVNYHDHRDWFDEAYTRMGTPARLVAFLKRVSPTRGGLEQALQDLRTQGPDTFLSSHAELPAPVARRTIVGRWPYLAIFLVWLTVRGWVRRRQEPRWPWWVIAPAASIGILSGNPATPWLLGILAGSLVCQARFKRWVPLLDLTLSGLLAGWLVGGGVAVFSWPAWWRRRHPGAAPPPPDKPE